MGFPPATFEKYRRGRAGIPTRHFRSKLNYANYNDGICVCFDLRLPCGIPEGSPIPQGKSAANVENPDLCGELKR